MPDPKLKTAMEEIKAVLKKHDIAAVVVLASMTHLEFLRQYQASWNGLKLEQLPEGVELRVRALREDFPSKEAHEECVALSVGTILGFRDALVNEINALGMVAELLAKHIQIEHMTKQEGKE
jgi:hypothetical protein